MRKAFTTLALSLLLLLCCFAESASSSMEVSAFKEAPLPDIAYTITIKDHTQNQTGTAISGIASIFDVSSKISSNRTIDKAFSIYVSSNLKNSISIGVKFTPLVNQDDKSITVPVTYKFSTSGLSQVKGSTYYQKTGRNYYFARYTPSLKIGGSTTGTYSIDQNTSYTLVFNPAETIQTGTATQNNSNNVRTWSNATAMPSTSGNTLPGFTGTNAVSGTANFGLSITESDYEALRANTDYVTTVTITISTV